MSLLQAKGLSVGYHGVAAIHELEMQVNRGEMVLLAGANGAGKSTTVMTLAGAIKPITGDVIVDGTPCNLPVHRRCQNGLGLITEERAIFPSLTVTQNLRLGRGEVSVALDYFPELNKRARAGAEVSAAPCAVRLQFVRVSQEESA
jgi:branched-chain amino acid transport system ATP-binding protein